MSHDRRPRLGAVDERRLVKAGLVWGKPRRVGWVRPRWAFQYSIKELPQ